MERGRPGRVLVVGGPERFRSVVATAVDDAGGDAATANDPDAAVATVADEEVGCVVSGLDVGDGDGTAFADRLRDRAPSVPYLQCVPPGDGTAVAAGFEAGATDVVSVGDVRRRCEAIARRALGLARRRSRDAGATAGPAPDGDATATEEATVDPRFAGADLATADSPEAVPAALAATATRLLDADACVLDAEGAAVAGDPATVPDAVVDAAPDGGARTVALDGPGPYRSALVVGYGDGATLAVLAGSADAFDGTAAAVVELLASLAAATLDGLETRSTLRTERDRYAWLFEHTSDAVARVEFDGLEPYIVAANDPFRETFDGGDDPVGEHLDDVVAEGQRREEAREVSRKVKRGELLEGELTRDTADGQRDFLWRSIPLRDDGEVYGAYAIYTDIDEQKRRERQLRGLTRSARRMLAADGVEDVVAAIREIDGDDVAVPDATLFRERDGRLRAAGGECDHGLGETVSPGETPVGEAYADREAVAFADGGTRLAAIPVGDHGVLVVDVPDRSQERVPEIARALATTVETALDRMERERLLREREAELEAERDRLAALFENVPDPALSYVIEDDGVRVTDVNSAFETVMGYDAEAVVGEDVNELIVPEGRDAEAAALDERIRRGERIHTEVRRSTADGQRDFLLRSVPIKVGDRTQGYSIYTDLTDQKRRERELERQNERLDEFASVIAHDLKNPLAVARGNVDLAIETGDVDPLDDAAASIARMSAMIDDLLALARKGRTVEDPEPVDPAEVVEAAWSTVSAAGADLTVRSLPDRLRADPDRLQEAFENLFRNAVEHGSTSPPSDGREDAVEHGSTGNRTAERSDAAAEHGSSDAGPDGRGADVTVTVGTFEDGLYVADDGRGIPPDERDEVFEHGYTTAEDGTGFGLAIVESVAQAHGWEVDVAASADGGARFEFLIPPEDRREG